MSSALQGASFIRGTTYDLVQSSPATLLASSGIPSPEPTIGLSVAGNDAVLVGLSTTLTISPYSRFYGNIPISSYQPTHTAFPDGSLLTPVFVHGMKASSGLLLALGVFLAFFIRNILVSLDYVRRGRVKHKYLFYVLFLSQVLGPVGLIPLIISYFKALNCTIVSRVATGTVILSESLLITGVLGVKAYRCLNDSRIVLSIISAFQVSIFALGISDLVRIQGKQQVTGSCALSGHTGFIRIVLFLFCAESAFICTCFICAIWKSSRTSTTPGRLSIHIQSTDAGFLEEPRPANSVGDARPRRGWWDYVPEVRKDKDLDTLDRSSRGDSRDHWAAFWSKLRRLVNWEDAEAPAHAYQRKSSLPGPTPLKHPGYLNASIGARDRERSMPPDAGYRLSQPLRFGRVPSPSASTRRLGKLIPRMELFKEVMRDEMCYTAFIVATCVIAAILSSIGLNLGFLFTAGGWVGLNWIVISFLNLHSFGRVVRRHEREAMMQNPSTWDPMYRAEEALGATPRHRHPESWRYWSSDLNTHRRTYRAARSPLRDSLDKSSEEYHQTEARQSRMSISWLRPRSASSSSLPSTDTKVASTPTTLSSFHALTLSREPSVRSTTSASPSELGIPLADVMS